MPALNISENANSINISENFACRVHLLTSWPFCCWLVGDYMYTHVHKRNACFWSAKSFPQLINVFALQFSPLLSGLWRQRETSDYNQYKWRQTLANVRAGDGKTASGKMRKFSKFNFQTVFTWKRTPSDMNGKLFWRRLVLLPTTLAGCYIVTFCLKNHDFQCCENSETRNVNPCVDRTFWFQLPSEIGHISKAVIDADDHFRSTNWAISTIYNLCIVSMSGDVERKGPKQQK